MIRSLQAGRAVAAIAVVFHHAGLSVRDFLGGMPRAAEGAAHFGYLGVDFFFVLSGFIIYFMNWDRAETAAWTARYFASRASRIYVSYLPVGLAVAMAYTALPGAAGAMLPWNWFTSVTLAPVGQPALTVAWTLQHEIFFYVLAWFLLRYGMVLAGSLIWAALIIVAQFAAIPFQPLALINIEFLFGMCAAWCFLNDKLQRDGLLILAGFSLTGAFLMFGSRDGSVIFGLGLACFILPIVRAESRGSFRVGPIWMELGAASYAIYLVHQPLISVLSRIATAVQGGWALTMAVLIVASIALGVAYHRIYELPALSFTRRHHSRATVRSSDTESSIVSPE